jgi:ATP-dependent RNA helicase RhlE
MTFKELEISEPILRALESAGYEQPTEIQEQVIPLLISGKDILASSQTGTGKTAAYTIPVLQKLSIDSDFNSKKKQIKALVLSPTRELAAQIGENIALYSKNLRIKQTIVFGGVPQSRQVNSMRNGVDIIVATPGRLLDLCNQGIVDLSTVETLILDEADQMLDMGFLPDMKKIISKCPNRNQTMMFSATIPTSIRKLSEEICNHPVRIAIVPVNQPLEAIDQSIYKLEPEDKKKLLIHILENQEYKSILVFTRTKYGADRLAKLLTKKEISNEVIHGNKSQNARTYALQRFKVGKSRVLLATDIVARGIDVKNLSLVINYDLPEQTEVYLHRMGRTGRAGFDGKVVSFCSRQERGLLRDIEKYIGMTIPEKSISKLDIAHIDINPQDPTTQGVKERVDPITKKASGVYRNKSSRFKNEDFALEDKGQGYKRNSSDSHKKSFGSNFSQKSNNKSYNDFGNSSKKGGFYGSKSFGKPSKSKSPYSRNAKTHSQRGN